MTTRALLVTTNGAGMGHLARMTAVALAGRRTGQIESSILTLSVAAPLAAGMGVNVEYCPSSARRWQPYWRWDAYFRDRLAAAITHGRFEVVVFDGVMPYDGLLAVMREFPEVRFAWCRRGFWRRDAKVTRRALAREGFFDAVIEPGDLAGADEGPTAGRASISTAPVSLLTEAPVLPREQSRSELGLADGRRYLFFAFGSGLSGDSKAVLRAVVQVAEANGWTVIATKPWQPSQQISGVEYIERTFPLSRHVHAFDAVVTSAGYNAVHEYVAAAVPTLIVANNSLVTDDQSARATGVAARGLALVATEVGEVEPKLARLLSGWRPATPPEPCTGAEEIAAAVSRLAAQPSRRRANRLSMKLAVMAVFGPWAIALVRGLRGRRSSALKISSVHLTGEMSDVAADASAARGDSAAEIVAVEHVSAMEPASEDGGGYGRARRELAARTYPSRL